MRLKGRSGGTFNYEIKPDHRKESAIWMLYLMDAKALIEKVIFKQNTKGNVRINIYIRNSNHLQIMADIKLRVTTDITKYNDLNRSQ